MQELLQRLLESNRQSRDSASNRIQRLTAVLQTGTVEEYHEAVEKILNESAPEPTAEPMAGDQPADG